jgi:hypothetical protein
LAKLQESRFFAALVFVVLAVPIVGCGDGGPSREKVSGTVTFDGQPLESGEILFKPAGGGGTPEGGPITNGKFEFRAVPGEKRIEISATREDAKPAADGLPNYVSFIPVRYNSQSTLSESVEKGGKNVFAFELKSGG